MEDAETDQLDITQWEASHVNGDGTFEIPDESEGSRTVERAPRIEKQSLPARAREFLAERQRKGTAQKSGSTVKKAPTKAVRVHQPRGSASTLIEWGWAMLSKMAVPISIPVARTLSMQAPVAGEILDDAVRDTAVDKLIQPFVRFGEGSEAVIALLGPPVLVGVMHKNPATVPALTPLLRAALVSWVKIAGPRMEVKLKEEQEFEEKYGSTVDALMEGIFAGIGEEETQQPEQQPQAPPPAPMPTPEPIAVTVPTMTDETPVMTMPHPMKAPVRPSGRATRVPPVKRVPPKKVTTE